MPWCDFLRCFMSVDVLKAHRGWFVNGAYSMQLHRGEFHPRQVPTDPLSLRDDEYMPIIAMDPHTKHTPTKPVSSKPHQTFNQAVEVRVPPLTTNWTYFSVVQPTKRGEV